MTSRLFPEAAVAECESPTMFLEADSSENVEYAS